MTTTPSNATEGVSLRVGPDRESRELMTLAIEGRLDSTTTGRIWRDALRAVQQSMPRRLVVDASKIKYCDGSGIGFFVELRLLQQKNEGDMEIRDLKPEFQQLLDMFDPSDFQRPQPAIEPARVVTEIGKATKKILEDLKSQVTFVGELSAALVYVAARPRRVRWKDVFLVVETAGVNALPIVALISFLVGLIMAFQAAIPMRQFGAEIFVADLIGLSMLRELGPLMTAIVLAGRSGSAFAAEFGTMKINEEIDALTTMGLDPVRFLVVTRVIAALLVTPLLSVFADLIGVIGGCFVLLSLGYPVVTYFNEVVAAVTYVDFLSGIFKSFVFAILISGIGCLRGLQTKTGAAAVGESTTRAVVSGIVLIVVTDGVFSVVYYYLGL